MQVAGKGFEDCSDIQVTNVYMETLVLALNFFFKYSMFRCPFCLFIGPKSNILLRHRQYSRHAKVASSVRGCLSSWK
jgi:hypothetical protein